jgi:hypothetical protein
MATTGAVTLPAITVAGSTEFSVTRLREFVTSSLSDATLQTYLAAALEAVDDVLGPATVTERINAGRGDLLMLSREAESIVSIVEDERWSALTLAADDYMLSDSGQLLYRLHTGTNPGWVWGGRVAVTYVRDAQAADRIRIAVALVQLDLDHRPGLAALSTEGYSETFSPGGTYQVERDAILASLTSGGWII